LEVRAGERRKMEIDASIAAAVLLVGELVAIAATTTCHTFTRVTGFVSEPSSGRTVPIEETFGSCAGFDGGGILLFFFPVFALCTGFWAVVRHGWIRLKPRRRPASETSTWPSSPGS
jgi:hypothetical protein